MCDIAGGERGIEEAFQQMLFVKHILSISEQPQTFHINTNTDLKYVFVLRIYCNNHLHGALQKAYNANGMIHIIEA